MNTSKPAGEVILQPAAPRRLTTGSDGQRVEEAVALEGQRQLPTFFVVGPPRTGTSWLHLVLGKRSILPDEVKETRFFDFHFHRGTDWYRAHFRDSDEDAVVGEIAPTYFISSLARERLVRTVPEARIVCIFRDPVERIFSHYRLKRAYGMIPWDLEAAILNDPELMEANRYATHLKEWLRTFGPDRVQAAIYDDLRDQPQAFVDSLAAMAGMPRFILTQLETERVHSSRTMTLPRSYRLTHAANVTADWCKARRLHSIVRLLKSSPLRKLVLGGGPPFTEMPEQVAVRLYEKFRPEVEELEVMLNRDLSAWKTPGMTGRVRLDDAA
jgi:Sulfotransferase domain